MNVFERIDRFQLHYDFIFSEEIEPVFANLVIFVEQCDRFLSNELDSTQCEFNCQCFRVSVFDKPRP